MRDNESGYEEMEPKMERETGEQPVSIAEFAGRPDFPQCLRGQVVDIGGYAGEVTDIVLNSIKVRSAEGVTRSFNYHTLRKLYGPRVEIEPMRARDRVEEPPPGPAEQPVAPVIEPDFSAPVQPVRKFTGRRDFPGCTLGVHLDIAGYQGVVVRIVDGSLKVKSHGETTRSYNASVLRKLYPGEPG